MTDVPTPAVATGGTSVDDLTRLLAIAERARQAAGEPMPVYATAERIAAAAAQSTVATWILTGSSCPAAARPAGRFP